MTPLKADKDNGINNYGIDKIESGDDEDLFAALIEDMEKVWDI